ncbi:hypothetical protein [Nocardia otitidiscaviarum]|uniref:hypothetical protein n=1 Tax=Nocardia otitidiscaviarum TaxID=1823 RepID=UPI0004A710D2|nr:hypothetical protein [Nocardia otitidiscaviarum]
MDEKKPEFDIVFMNPGTRYYMQPKNPIAAARANRFMEDHGVRADIEGMTSKELGIALKRLEELIGTCGSKRGEELVLSDGSRTSYSQVYPYVVLRRNAIRHRVTAQILQDEMAEIKGAVEEKVDNPEVRKELSDMVSAIQKQQEELDAKLREQQDVESQEIRRVELSERKWKMRKSILEREPAAVLIGGLLLVVITGALLVGMFTRIEAPEIVSSGFLLILGFFFGQTAGGRDKSGE